MEFAIILTILYIAIFAGGMWLLFKVSWIILRKITIAVYGKTDPWDKLSPKDKEKYK